MIPGLGGDSECWGGMFPRKLREGGIDPAVYDPRGSDRVPPAAENPPFRSTRPMRRRYLRIAHREELYSAGQWGLPWQSGLPCTGLTW